MSTHLAWALFSKIWGRVLRSEKDYWKLSSKFNGFGMKKILNTDKTPKKFRYSIDRPKLSNKE